MRARVRARRVCLFVRWLFINTKWGNQKLPRIRLCRQFEKSLCVPNIQEEVVREYCIKITAGEKRSEMKKEISGRTVRLM